MAAKKKAKFRITTVNLTEKVQAQARRKVDSARYKGVRMSFSSYVQGLIEKDLEEKPL